MTPRKKKAYLVLFTLCGAAFTIDRILLAPVAQTAIAGPTSLSDLGIDTGDSPPVDVANAPFPRTLPAIDLEHPIRDAFAMTPKTQKRLLNGERDDMTKLGNPGKPVVSLAEEFRNSHRISAVMVSRGSSVVVVSGRWLRVGDSLDGCTLAEVRGAAATFDCQGQSVELSALGNSEPVK